MEKSKLPHYQEVVQFLERFPDLICESDLKLWKRWHKVPCQKPFTFLVNKNVPDRFLARAIFEYYIPDIWKYRPVDQWYFSDLRWLQVDGCSRRVQKFAIETVLLGGRLVAKYGPTQGHQDSDYNSLLRQVMRSTVAFKTKKEAFECYQLTNGGSDLQGYAELMRDEGIDEKWKFEADKRIRVYLAEQVNVEKVASSYVYFLGHEINGVHRVLPQELLYTQIEFVCSLPVRASGADTSFFFSAYRWLESSASSPRSRAEERARLKVLTALFTQCEGVQRYGQGGLRGADLVKDVYAEYGKSRGLLGKTIRVVYAAYLDEQEKWQEGQKQVDERAALEREQQRDIEKRLERVLSEMRAS